MSRRDINSVTRGSAHATSPKRTTIRPDTSRSGLALRTALHLERWHPKRVGTAIGALRGLPPIEAMPIARASTAAGSERRSRE
ncbi:hypothetical protein F7R21_11655 [Burkholderia latens]|uniref:Uncharacterized protein n=1 Tax=Burkholderia latens TaxID=488446 RepID=A0A6H9TQ68_9BURK|nr:hypothetical protein F7R21_11655 [Burkholderia latens]